MSWREIFTACFDIGIFVVITLLHHPGPLPLGEGESPAVARKCSTGIYRASSVRSFTSPR